MIFASVSGSSVATTFAIGAILIPAMVKHGYPVGTAAAIQAASAELGVLIPPSIPLILYGVSTETSIGQLFLAGVGPGLLVAAALFAYLLVLCRIKGYGKEDGRESHPFFRALVRSFWALLMPFVVLGGIYGGVFTPTEASAIAVVYAFFVGCVIYRAGFQEDA
jgi:tripartite ATP-independent transporter DctM subunit